MWWAHFISRSSRRKIKENPKESEKNPWALSEERKWICHQIFIQNVVVAIGAVHQSDESPRLRGELYFLAPRSLDEDMWFWSMSREQKLHGLLLGQNTDLLVQDSSSLFPLPQRSVIQGSNCLDTLGLWENDHSPLAYLHWTYNVNEKQTFWFRPLTLGRCLSLQHYEANPDWYIPAVEAAFLSNWCSQQYLTQSLCTGNEYLKLIVERHWLMWENLTLKSRFLRYMHPHVYSTTVHNSQNMEAT